MIRVGDDESPKILGPDGRPWKEHVNGVNDVHVKAGGMFMSGWSDYLQSLSSSRLPPQVRAMDPFGNHVWVFAAAMVIAVAASQAELMVFRETDEQIESRRRAAKARGKTWTPRSGRARRALGHHGLGRGWARRVVRRGLEPDPDHPLNDILSKPNPYQNGNQLMHTTHLWLAVRGEVFWVFTDANGDPVAPGGIPEVVWPISPDLFFPVWETLSGGALVGWELRVPHWMPVRARASRLILSLDEVAQFKFPNPDDPTRGMSRLSAAALSIESDLLARTQNKTTIENGSVLKGVIMHDDMIDIKEEREFLRRFEERHSGPAGANRTAILSGGFKYVPVQMSPADIQLIEQMRWNRDEIFAAMGVPKTVVGVTEALNYATQLGQDRNFYDKTIIPMYRTEETTIDESLLVGEPDTVTVLHDLSSIEALRVGTQEKIEMAKSMAGSELHVPPRTAYEVVGLEVPEYLGDEEVLVAGLGMLPVSLLLEDPSLGQPPPPPSPEEDPEPEPEPEEEPSAVRLEEFATPRRRTLVKAAGKRWVAFIKAQSPIESQYRSRYKGWVAAMRSRTLASLDDATLGRGLRLLAVVKQGAHGAIPPLGDMQDDLRARITPIASNALQVSYSFTLDDLGGIATFEFDHPALQAFFDRRMSEFMGKTPSTLRVNLVRAIDEGIRLGESVQQLRVRVGQVFDIAASSAKALQVARTESAAVMAGSRDVMLGLAGVTEEAWGTANDESVRADHVTFGDAGPQPRGFNYLDLVGQASSGGVLAFPHDMRCRLAGQVVNCRCLSFPTK